MKPDLSIYTLIGELRKLSDEFSMENDDERAAHVMNAIVDLRKAFSAEYLAHLAKQDLERLGALRAS